MIFRIDRDIYKKLSESEKKIVDFINSEGKAILSLSITQIANKTFTSPPTVSRAIQKCGFSGINDLRNTIEQQYSDKNSISAPYVVDNILAKTFRECTLTMDSINPSDIYELIEKMNSANRIYIYSRGFTGLVAEEFQMYLQLQGYNAVIVNDVIWMNNTRKIVHEDDLVIILTVRNTTPELLASAKAAKKIGAPVVSLCCKEDSGLEEYSDITILGHSEKIMKIRGLTVYSRIGLSVITRTIMEYIATGFLDQNV